MAATNAGMILGTAGYMSPEQARGHEADQRSDVFSFGCVLYEMLTGRRAFQGETVTDIIASVVARDPDFRALPAGIHPRTEDVLRRCMAKNRKDRWHAIADVRVELESIAADPHGMNLQSDARVERRPLWKRAMPAMITGIVVAMAAIGGTVAVMKRAPASSNVTRFSFITPEGQTLDNSARNLLAISPDGLNIVYAASQQLYLRTMGEIEPRPIPGTSLNASRPFFSPDGRWIGFFSRNDRKLKKIAITGGAAVTIGELALPENTSYSPIWNPDDQIYIGEPGGIWRVSANGGKPERILELKQEEVALTPQILPDGDHVLFTLGTGSGSEAWDKAKIVVQSLKSGERKLLVDGGTDGRYVPTGHLVYALASTLLAYRFDIGKMQVIGGPVPVAEGVGRTTSGGVGGGGEAYFGFSETGSLVYIAGNAPSLEPLTLAMVDRNGNKKTLNIPPRPYAAPRVSPDGKQLAMFTSDSKESVVWVYDLAEVSPLRRLTFGGQNHRPLWAPDNQHIVFTSDRDGEPAFYWQRADGSGSAERLFVPEKGTTLPQAESFTLDGKTVVFLSVNSQSVNPASRASVYSVTLGTNEKPKLLVSSAANPNLSPNGKWLAYSSLELCPEVYVRPFPVTGEIHQITTTGGSNPLWAPDGKQLFYMTSTVPTQLVSVDVQTEPKFAFGKPKPLPIQGLAGSGPRRYDITPDGKYFVVMLTGNQTSSDKLPRDQFNVVLNWFTELQQRVPVR